MLTVAIIGAGPLGRRLALAAARAGLRVFLEDVMPANLHHARESIRQHLGPEALPAVTFVSTIEDAVRQADLVVDCVPDELESKLEILWLLDRMAPPRTIFATPTMHLSADDLAACTYRPQQCIAIAAAPTDFAGETTGALRLLAAAATSDATIGAATSFFAQLGFTPVVERSSVSFPARV